MTKSGYSNYATTKRYINLAGECFPEEVERLEDHLWGGNGRKAWV